MKKRKKKKIELFLEDLIIFISLGDLLLCRISTHTVLLKCCLDLVLHCHKQCQYKRRYTCSL